MGKSTIEIQLYKKVMLYQVCTIKVNNAMQYVMNCSAVQFISVTWKSVVDSFLKFWVCPEEYLLVFGIIQFLKVMYLFLTLQVHPTLRKPSEEKICFCLEFFQTALTPPPCIFGTLRGTFFNPYFI